MCLVFAHLLSTHTHIHTLVDTHTELFSGCVVSQSVASKFRSCSDRADMRGHGEWLDVWSKTCFVYNKCFSSEEVISGWGQFLQVRQRQHCYPWIIHNGCHHPEMSCEIINREVEATALCQTFSRNLDPTQRRTEACALFLTAFPGGCVCQRAWQRVCYLALHDAGSAKLTRKR